MARKLNPFFEVAKRITEAMNPDPRRWDNMLAMNLSHLSKLCNPKKARGGTVYDPEVVYAAWQDMRQTLEDSGLSTPSIMALLNKVGDRTRIDDFIYRLLEGDMPPVYETAGHDNYIRKHCKVLSKVGFVYRAGRIPVEELEEMGIKHEIPSN